MGTRQRRWQLTHAAQEEQEPRLQEQGFKEQGLENERFDEQGLQEQGQEPSLLLSYLAAHRSKTNAPPLPAN